MEVQWEEGLISPVEVTAARVAHQNSQLSVKDAQRLEAEARGQLAEAIGVPLRALAGLKFLFPDLAVFPTNLTAAEIQRQAITNRADVLGALAE